MTDLEMTRLCEEAIGFIPYYDQDNPANRELIQFNPLHDDAQAMALVKKFRLFIDSWYDNGALLDSEKKWSVEYNDGEQAIIGESRDLNRAIVECCARLQLERQR